MALENADLIIATDENIFLWKFSMKNQKLYEGTNHMMISSFSTASFYSVIIADSGALWRLSLLLLV